MTRLGPVLSIAIAAGLASAGAPTRAGQPAGLNNFGPPAISAPLSPPRVSIADPTPGDDEEAAPAPGGDDAAGPVKPGPAPAPVQTNRQKLDDLYARLAASTDAAETNGLVAAIDRLELASGSDADDLLMARAVAALGTHNLEIALTLLDKIVILQPDWAEAWNKRATVRYLMGDDQQSMADIARVLVLEPRHFGALSGMGMILERRGFRDGALRAYRRALEVAPQLESVKNAVDRLTKAVDGQSL
jgi:tetratricopeptide (TPR) repeat protein